MGRSEIESSTESETEHRPDGPDEEAAPWHPARKLLFRFAWIYFLWYAVPDFAAGQTTFLSRAMDRLAAWVGEHVLGLGEVALGPTGSGDMTVHYVKLLVMVAGSLAGAVAWTLLDRRRRHYQHLGEWLHVACRYYLMVVMLGYGFAKVFPGQFPTPSLGRLLQTFGDAYPMELLWAAIGYSPAYAAFAGLGEITGGLLLALRRTTTLGALIVACVMSNVVMMNFAYEVPVKLYSSHLLLMALVLVALDGRRLANVLVLNRPAPANLYPPHFTSRQGRLRARVAKVAIIGFLLLLNLQKGLFLQRTYGPEAPTPTLYGIYDVETFVLGGEVLPPLLTDDRRWQNVSFDRRRQLAVRKMDGEVEFHTFGVEGANRLGIFIDDETGRGWTRTQWTFERPSAGILSISGELDGSAVELEMKARDLDEVPLLAHGFHWIHEVPMQRPLHRLQ